MRAEDITEDVLRNMLQSHFLYEFRMFNQIVSNAGYIITNNEKLDRSFRSGLIVDFMVLHARNLKEFFYRNANQHYPTAQRFIKPNISWRKIRPPMSDRIQKVDDHASEWVVHISFERSNIPDPYPGWDFHGTYLDFAALTRLFLENVDSKYINRELDELLKHVKLEERNVDN